MFVSAPRFCDVTGEVVDENGAIRFYRCTREPNHSGAWHVGIEFGPNYIPADDGQVHTQMFPVVGPQARVED